jgi:hypothetical protein
VIGDSLKHNQSKELARRLIDFVEEAERQLRLGERLPMSTEILESAFGLYGGSALQERLNEFTRLLTRVAKTDDARGCHSRLQPRPGEGRKSMGSAAPWFDGHLTSQRRLAEHKASLKSATTQHATT